MSATLRTSAPCTLPGSTKSFFATGARQVQLPSPGRAVVAHRSLTVTATASKKAITKKELISKVADRVPQLTKKEAELAVDTMLNLIIEAVSTGEKVNIAGFGTFEPRDRSARKGRNPQTGEELQIAATRVPAFSASKFFKEEVKASMNGSH